MEFKKYIGKTDDKQAEPAPSFGSSSPSPSPAPATGQQNILSSDVTIKGKIRFTNGLTVDGKIDGEIDSDGTLTVKENAKLKAEIRVRSIEVHGKIHGNITVKEQAVIRKTAEVIGDVKAATLSIEAGATFVGKSTVGTPSSPVQPSSSPSPNKPQDTGKKPVAAP